MLCAPVQRLMRDFKRLRSDPPQGVDGSPNPENIMKWNAVIFGPEDTPWDGGECRMLLLLKLTFLRGSNLYELLLCHADTTVTLFLCRHVQIDAGVCRGLPKQTAGRQVRLAHVPPQQ